MGRSSVEKGRGRGGGTHTTGRLGVRTKADALRGTVQPRPRGRVCLQPRAPTGTGLRATPDGSAAQLAGVRRVMGLCRGGGEVRGSGGNMLEERPALEHPCAPLTNEGLPPPSSNKQPPSRVFCHTRQCSRTTNGCAQALDKSGHPSSHGNNTQLPSLQWGMVRAGVVDSAGRRMGQARGGWRRNGKGPWIPAASLPQCSALTRCRHSHLQTGVCALTDTDCPGPISRCGCCRLRLGAYLHG